MIESLVLPAVLTLLRVSAFIMFLQPLGSQYLPNTVKIGIVMVLTFFWLPNINLLTISEATIAQAASTTNHDSDAQSPHADSSKTTSNDPAVRQWVQWIYLAIRETTFGAILGWTMGTILLPIRMAGAWIADQLGLTLAEVTAGIDNGASNVMSMSLEVIGTLLLFTLSVHHNFLRIFDHALDNYAVGQPWQFPQIGRYIVFLNQLPAMGLQIAAPLTVIAILVVVALMFAMKQSPQFNWFGFGMTARLGTGLLVLVFVLPGILSNILRHLETFLFT